MTVTTPQTQGAAPIVVGSTSYAVARTLSIDEVTIEAGIWADWQRRNREVSIPTNLDSMQREGVLRNLRIAAGETEGEFRGPVFMDAAVYKTLEAAIWELHRTPDDRVSGWVREVIALIGRAQQADGYLNSYVQVVAPESRYTSLDHSHEVYLSGFLIQAAIAGTRTGLEGAAELLRIARQFADHLVDTFLENRAELDGHPGVEFALIELARLTGNQQYLRLASKFVLGRGAGRVGPDPRRRYFQDHASVLEAPTEVGHAVRALFLETAVVDLYLETGDPALLRASTHRWNDLVATKTYLTGGMGSRHSEEAFGDAFELPPDRAYAETCAAFAGIVWNWRLLLATGESRYADLIERILFNVFAASTSSDGSKYFYVNPLQRRADHFESDDPGRRREWFWCPCCPPNVTRMVATLSHYIATVDTDTVFVHQYMDSRIDTRLAAGRVSLRITTRFPWEGQVSVVVEDAPEDEFTLALRLPAWSRSATITVAGSLIDSRPDAFGYLAITRLWRAQDNVELMLDIAPRLVFPDTRIDAVRGTAALMRGPLVYCIEQADQASDVLIDDVMVDAAAVIRPRAATLEGVGETVLLEVDAIVLDRPAPRGLPYSSDPEPSKAAAASVTAIPYFQWDNRGAGAMRVWLPVAAHTAETYSPTR